MMRRRSAARGLSLLEVITCVGLLALLVVGAAPATRRALARERALLSARSLASEVRLRRSEAVAAAVARAIVFNRTTSGAWTESVIEDGDGDGVRADDIRRRVDPLREGPEDFEDRHAGARLGFHPQLTELRSPPPTSAPLGPLEDPIRLGLSDMVTFSPRGTITSGTIYLTDGSDTQLAIVLYGQTGRVRVWEYDLSLRRWQPRF